jgi:hypothetical protein
MDVQNILAAKPILFTTAAAFTGVENVSVTSIFRESISEEPNVRFTARVACAPGNIWTVFVPITELRASQAVPVTIIGDP